MGGGGGGGDGGTEERDLGEGRGLPGGTEGVGDLALTIQR